MDRLGVKLSTWFLQNVATITKEEQRALYTQIKNTEEKYKALLEQKQEKIDALIALTAAPIHEQKNPPVPISTEALPQNEETELHIDMPQFLISVDGNHLLEGLIADGFGYDKDDSSHRPDILQYMAIVKACVDNYPEPWIPNELTYNANGSNHGIPRSTVISRSKILFNNGWLTETNFKGSPAYDLSKKTTSKLNGLMD